MGHLKWKGEPVRVHEASCEEELDEVLDVLGMLDINLDLNTVIRDKKALSSFLRSTADKGSTCFK